MYPRGSERAADDEHGGRDEQQERDRQRIAPSLGTPVDVSHQPEAVQTSLLSRAASAAAADRQSSSRRPEGVEHRAGRGDERARRPAREGAGDVGRARALRADARAGAGPPAAAAGAPRRSRAGGSRRRPRRRSRGRARRRGPRPSSATSRATWCQSGRPSESARSWTSAPPAFEVLTRQKMPAAVAPAGGEERLERVAAEVRVDGQRVGERRSASSRGSRYAAAYARAVEPMSPRFPSAIDEQPGGARVGAHLLERAHAVGAERLEERELRLDARRRTARPRRRSRSRSAERLGGLGAAEVRVAAQLDRQQVGARVEPDDELAALAARRPRRAGRRRSTSRPAAPPRVLRHQPQGTARRRRHEGAAIRGPSETSTASA